MADAYLPLPIEFFWFSVAVITLTMAYFFFWLIWISIDPEGPMYRLEELLNRIRTKIQNNK